MTTKFALFFALDFWNSATTSTFLLLVLDASSSFMVETPFVTESVLVVFFCDDVLAMISD